MKQSEIYDRMRSGEILIEEAAAMMVENDKQDYIKSKPRFMPLWFWLMLRDIMI